MDQRAAERRGHDRRRYEYDEREGKGDEASSQQCLAQGSAANGGRTHEAKGRFILSFTTVRMTLGKKQLLKYNEL
jgi:hypothetical protein